MFVGDSLFTVLHEFNEVGEEDISVSLTEADDIVRNLRRHKWLAAMKQSEDEKHASDERNRRLYFCSRT